MCLLYNLWNFYRDKKCLQAPLVYSPGPLVQGYSELTRIINYDTPMSRVVLLRPALENP